MGIGLFDTILLGLLCDDTGKPNWLPIGLFDIAEQDIPTDWRFSLLDGKAASGGESSNRWIAKWGYPELVDELRHSDQLIEREPGALDIFFRQLERARNLDV